MSDSNSNIKIDITASVDGAGFVAGTAQVDKVTAAFNKTDLAVAQANKSFDAASASSNKMAEAVARNEAVTRRYKQAVEDSWAAHERAAEKIYVVNDAYLKAAGGAEKSALGTAGAKRELMVLGHEALNGNFSRMPGSFMVLAERMNFTGALLNPLTIGFVALSAVAAGMGVAFAKGREEMNAMNNALLVTSNYAGLTRGGMESLAASMAQGGQITIGASKEIVTSLVASGRIGADAIGTVARLTSDFAHATGQDISKIAPEMVKLFSDPLKGAEELNRSMHFLTATDMEHIATLEQLGRTQEAQLFLAQKVADHMPKEAENIGIAAKAWRGLKDAISGAADALMGIGKTNTVEDELTRKSAQLADQWMRTGRFNISTQNEYNALLAQSATQQEKSTASAAAAKKITDENELATLAKQNSEIWKKYETSLKIARLTGAAIPEAPSMDAVQHDAAYQLQKKTDPKATHTKIDPNETFIAALQREVDIVGLTAGQIKVYDAAKKGMIGTQMQTVIALANEEDAQKATAEATKKAHVAASAQADVIGRLTGEFDRNIEAQRRSMEIMPEAQRKLGAELDKIGKNADTATHSATKYFSEGKLTAAEYADTMAKITEETNRQRAAVEALAAEQARLNGQWEYGAKNAMQKYLDEVTNVAKQSERLFTNAFKVMEDALVKFVRTGKLDFKSLADGIINDLIRIQIQQSIMKPMATAMDSAGGFGGLISGIFGGGNSTPAGASASTLANFGPTPAALGMLASFAVGTDYVPYDMVAQIHKGERIVPAAQNNGMSGSQVSVSTSFSPVINAAPGTDTAGIIAAVRQLMPGFIAENQRTVLGAVNQALVSRGSAPIRA